MLALVATNASRSKVAPAALSELKNACDLFQAASSYGGRAVKFFVSVFPLELDHVIYIFCFYNSLS